MSRIYKYVLEVTDEQVIEMPIGSKILTVQAQNDIPCLWAIVDPGSELEHRVIVTHGTGHPFNDTSFYIGTYQLMGGAFIGHVFERKV